MSDTLADSGGPVPSPRPPSSRLPIVTVVRPRSEAPPARTRRLQPRSLPEHEERRLRAAEVEAAQRSADADARAATAQQEAAVAAREGASAQVLAVEAQRRGVTLQMWGTIVAAAAALAAVVAVLLQSAGLGDQAEANRQTARAARLETVMSAIGADDPAVRMGGMTLLSRHVEDQLSAAEKTPRPTDRDDLVEWGRAQADAVSLYGSALDLFEMYVRDPQRSEGVAFGQGEPDVPPDVTYALNQITALFDLGPRVNAVNQRLPKGRDEPDAASLPQRQRAPSVDLTRAPLFNAPLKGADPWAMVENAGGAVRFVGADLRGATLREARLDHVKFTDAFLQCADLAVGGAETRPARLVEADLRGADLRGADLHDAVLTRADLRGADLRGANLAGARVDGARLAGSRVDDTFGVPIGATATPEGHRPGQVYDRERCTARPEYWRPRESPARPPMPGLPTRSWSNGIA